VLGRYFGERYCERLNRPRLALSTCSIELLLHYDWPGNIRELENLVERIVILKSNREVGPDDVRFLRMHADHADDDVLDMNASQKRHIERVLRMTAGQVGGAAGAARVLGLKKSTLQYRMKRLGIRASDFKS